MFRAISAVASIAIIISVGWSADAFAAAGKRVALVIGNSAYMHSGTLANPRNDAELIGGTLQRAGFEVISGIDLRKSAMREIIDQFTEAADEAEIALIYYAGHGMQIDGQNYLVPVDAKLERAPQVRTQTISLDVLLEALPQEPAVNILILDACRDNPLSRSLQAAVSRSGRVERGLANVQASQSNHGAGGLLIAYATDPDDVAIDGEGHNSPYSAALARHLTEPGLEIQSALTRVRAEVTQNTGGKQRPWANASLSREVFLGEEASTMRGDPAQQPIVVPGVTAQTIDWEVEQTLWDEASKRNTITHYEFYLKQYPNGRFAPLAILNLDQLKGEQEVAANPATAAPATATTAQDSPAGGQQPLAQIPQDNVAQAQQALALAQQQAAAAATDAAQQQAAVAVQQQQELALAQPVDPASQPQVRAVSPVVISEMMKQVPGTPETDALIGFAYNREQAIDLQLRLAALNFEVGGFDGKIGNKSRMAIASWQGQLDLKQTSFLTMEQYNFLVLQTEPLMEGARARYEAEKAEAARRAKAQKQRVARNNGNDKEGRTLEGRVPDNRQSGNNDALIGGIMGGLIGGVLGGALNK